jgi:hypothetical protein
MKKDTLTNKTTKTAVGHAKSPASRPADKTELAKTQPAAGTLAPAVDIDLDDAGGGFENQDASDRQMPFLNLLQPLSPVVAESPDNGGIDGAKAGDFINTATNEIYCGKTGVVFVPAVTDHQFVEWVDRDKGTGGFVKSHPLGSPMANAARGQFGKIVIPGMDPTHYLAETFYVFGILVTDDADATPLAAVCIPFVSKKIKEYKMFFGTRLSQFQVEVPDGNGGKRRVTPALFSHRVRMTSVDDRQDNKPFKNVRLDCAGDSILSSMLGKSHPAYQMAKKLREDFSAGVLKVQQPTNEAAGSGDPDTGGAF